MNNIFYHLSFIILIFFLMQISTRKYEFTTKSAFIISNSVNDYEHLWILNTSCFACVIYFSCNYLELYSYHSIIFTPSFHHISSDATFRNYSTCPFHFSAKTNLQGFYFVYHYLFYFKNRDYFNFSYYVNDDKSINVPNKEFKYECFTFHFSTSCLESKKIKNNHSTKLRFSLSVDSNDLFSHRFMHASSNVGQTIYVHGGLSSTNISSTIFIRLLNNIWEIVPIDPRTQKPPCLYGHSMTYYNKRNELILFGGSICGFSLEFNDVVWIFSIETGMWIMYKSNKMKPVMGHSSHIYQDVMYSFFGLSYPRSSRYEVMSFIQKFNIISRKWMKEIYLVNTSLMYHCSYNFGDQVWFSGGLYMTKTSNQVRVSSHLYSFDFLSEKWNLLSDNGPRLYLHACSYVNNVFIALGGFRAEKSEDFFKWSQSLSHFLYVYNGTSKKWSNIFMNFTIFGHRILKFNNDSSIIILGGKSSDFQKNLILEASENCTKQSNSQESFCQAYFTQPKNTDLIWPLLSSERCDFQQCDNCVRRLCAWCTMTKRCISKVQFASLYAIGGCEMPILYESQCPVRCELLSSSGCRNCTKLSFCGWCEFRNYSDKSQHLSGVGACLEGTINGPSRSSNEEYVNKYCSPEDSLNNWYFIPSKCINCTCNGHSLCSQSMLKTTAYSKEISLEKTQCWQCLHNTTGDECQYCENGFQGSAVNGQMCTECKCVKDKYASHCSSTGICEDFCIEKGRIGSHCEECDVQKNFTKFYDMCVFRAKINFKYVFDGKTEHFNQYTNKVNFLLSNFASNMDLHFKIKCLNTKEAKIKVELFNDSGERKILKNKNCDGFETSFPKFLFKGLITYQLLFTVSGFQNFTEPPFQLEMIFTQKTYINLPYIFISFFACLSASVLSFYTVYKLRQHINRRNHQYRTLLVMERPFAKVHLATYSNKPNDEDHIDIVQSSSLKKSCTFNVEPSSYESNISNVPLLCIEPYKSTYTRKPISSEECRSLNNNAIASVIFLSPICKFSKSSGKRNVLSEQYSPRILLGSTITKLTKIDKKVLVELPTKYSSGNNIMVDRDFDTSVSPSAAEELLTTEV